VLGHSFGGYMALESALRNPGSLSHPVLADASLPAIARRWSL
jgi:pimeloyl-ACP methyl ester carboxylesterase